jgi:UTP--glucose-1-phosphate uridylyltransferase
MSNQKITKAVIPVAGLGTRMLPTTKALRKEMLPVAGKPMIQHAVEEASASGIKTVVLVTGERGATLLEHFERNPSLERLLEECGQFEKAERLRQLSSLVSFCTVPQAEPLGLGHAVYCARNLIGDEPFAVILPDVVIHASVPCTAQLIQGCETHSGSFIAIRHLHQQELQRHGIVDSADFAKQDSLEVFRLSRLIEKPLPENAPSHFGIFGRYVLEPAIFEYLERVLSTSSGEVQLTEALNLMAKDRSVFGLLFDGEHFDAGDPLGFITANIALSLKIPELEIELRR